MWWQDGVIDVRPLREWGKVGNNYYLCGIVFPLLHRRKTEKDVIMAIFSIYYQISGKSLAVTNFVSLAEETGFGINKLKYQFTDLKKNFLHKKGIVIIKSEKLIKGKQRVSY